MVKPRARSMSMILRELLGCIDDRTGELAALRAAVARLRKERDVLASQLRFAIEQANRETLAASRLHAELLSRTTVPSGKVTSTGGGGPAAAGSTR